MERKVVIVCAVVGFLGVLSAALGFAAEATRVKVRHRFASSPRLPRCGRCAAPAVASLVAYLLSLPRVRSRLPFRWKEVRSLAIARAVIDQVSDVQTSESSGECIYPRSPALALGLLSAVALMLAQCTFIIAFLLLLTGAALNDQRGEENMYFGSFCYVVKPGVFSGGAVLSLASVALAIVYYVALTSSKSPPTLTPQNQGIAMGQPVIPQQSSEPVFVHEDTYNRQQFP
ncbi:hypothetical protein PR202_ga18341 [Eleusine coracana subsp. coracana]|uniref:Uncharacterized protein n=1 Tax=Eleusine coracana subsp. coracana TaxID=191504 RepID=A0AAV5CTJ1_ELECO|nr:hypothetical protein PR202_ga18341 [Eleusine coracana subsp. coracana]